MSEPGENICRVCFNIPDEFDIIDEITKEIFDVLLLKMNFDVSKNAIICRDCLESANKCFYFKSIWMDAEECILSLADAQNETGIDLKDLYKDNKNIRTKDLMVCRFCKDLIKIHDFVPIDDLVKHPFFGKMLPVYTPEMDINIIKNPIICNLCIGNLEYYFKFVLNCLAIEEKINKYSQYIDHNMSSKVKLTDVLRFLCEDHLDNPDKFTQATAINEEKFNLGLADEEYNRAVKAEEIDIKDVDITKHVARRSENISEDTCALCGYRPSRKSYLKIHMLTHKEIAKENMYKCALCSFATPRDFYLKNHIRNMHRDISEIHTYKCPDCPFQTKHKYYLKHHSLIHKSASELETYDCPKCSFKTKCKKYLKSHMVTHKETSEGEMHKCTKCTFQTKYKYVFKTHMVLHEDPSRVHTFKCASCPYETCRKAALQRHFLVHKTEGVALYKCPICSYKAKRTDTLKKHLIVHRDDSEVKTYKCEKCMYETKHKESLKRHMQRHQKSSELEMFKCTLCAYKSRLKHSLESHMLSHRSDSEVRYECASCGFKTHRKRNLIIHMQMHKDPSERKTYKCDLCTFETRNKFYLKQHNMRFHKNS